MKEGILSRISAAVKASAEYRDSFSSYSHLWTDNRQEFLMQFLVYGHVPTQVFALHKLHVRNMIKQLFQEEIEQAGDEGIPENPPTLAQFKQQVDNYEKVYLEVDKFEVTPINFSSME